MAHHGDMRAELQMPWKPPGVTGPTIVAMWTIASHITGDTYGATVFVGERDNALTVFLVEKRGSTSGLSRMTSLLRMALVTWRNGAFGVTSYGYLVAMQQLKSEEPHLADRLLAVPVQRAVLKTHIGHEETVSGRPLFVFLIKRTPVSGTCNVPYAAADDRMDIVPDVGQPGVDIGNPVAAGSLVQPVRDETACEQQHSGQSIYLDAGASGAHADGPRPLDTKQCTTGGSGHPERSGPDTVFQNEPRGGVCAGVHDHDGHGDGTEGHCAGNAKVPSPKPGNNCPGPNVPWVCGKSGEYNLTGIACTGTP